MCPAGACAARGGLRSSIGARRRDERSERKSEGVADLDVDDKRRKAIEALVEMAGDAERAGQAGAAAGYFDEAARLVEAHSENTPSEAAATFLRQQAEEYRAKARLLRGEGEAGAASAAPPSAPVASAWEVLWTHGGPEGLPAPAPASDGAPWEPFALAHAPDGVLFGWRRRAR
ncbi:MAG: hypothetical protein D6731_02515 [Planctomycetota bacterium]|nr:MAG: hypothetical protein D6731_02515 [Planctomycetota bacterium]